jgi:hypothetical protein
MLGKRTAYPWAVKSWGFRELVDPFSKDEARVSLKMELA